MIGALRCSTCRVGEYAVRVAAMHRVIPRVRAMLRLRVVPRDRHIIRVMFR